MLLATVLLSAALAPQAPPPEAAASAAPSPAAAHVDAGVAAFKRRRFTAARTEFEKAVEADPTSAAACYYLGYTYYKMGEPARRMNANKEKAKELFARAFALDPTFSPTWGR